MQERQACEIAVLAGARNAALLAVAILANSRPELRGRLRQFRAEQSAKVLGETLP